MLIYIYDIQTTKDKKTNIFWKTRIVGAFLE